MVAQHVVSTYCFLVAFEHIKNMVQYTIPCHTYCLYQSNTINSLLKGFDFNLMRLALVWMLDFWREWARKNSKQVRTVDYHINSKFGLNILILPEKCHRNSVDGKGLEITKEKWEINILNHIRYSIGAFNPFFSALFFHHQCPNTHTNRGISRMLFSKQS